MVRTSTNREILTGDLKRLLPPGSSEGRLIGIRPYVANKVLESGSEDHGSNDPRRE